MTFILRKPQIVLLDWDETIIETRELFQKVLRQVLQNSGLEQKSFEEQYKKLCHRSIRDSFPIMFGKDWQAIWDKYREVYAATVMEGVDINIMPGAKEFLERLKSDGIKLGIVSNKSHDLLLREVKQLELEGFFSSIVGAGIASNDKPSAAHATLALEEIKKGQNIENTRCWLVGDSDVDVSCAINSNIIPVLLNWAGKAILSIEYLKKNKVPSIIVQSFEELLTTYKNL